MTSSLSPPPTARILPSGSSTLDGNQRAWLRLPTILLSTLSSAPMVVSVVNGLAGIQLPGGGPSVPPKVMSFSWLYGGVMISDATWVPLRAPRGLMPVIDQVLEAGSNICWKLIIASSAPCPNGPHIWPTPV